MNKYFLFFTFLASVAIIAASMIVSSCKDSPSVVPKDDSIPVIDVSLDKNEISFEYIGSTKKLTATIVPEDATKKGVSWGSDHPEIADVDYRGWVMAKSFGECIITVTTDDGNKQATCQVIVMEPPTVEPPTVEALTSYKVNMTGGKVIFDGHSEIIEYGFCWSTQAGQAAASGNDYMEATDGNQDDFNYLCCDLLADTRYYVRAYAKNHIGTGYSEEVTVTTLAVVSYGSVADRWDNATNYKTVQIGAQTWTTEDIRNHWNDGSTIFGGEVIKDHSAEICPAGWHIPSKADWNQLIDETGGEYLSPKTLRIKNEWCSYATNSTGFDMIPHAIDPIGRNNNYWTSDHFWVGAINRNDGFYLASVLNEYIGSPFKSGLMSTILFYEAYNGEGHPVRCVKN